MGFGILAMAIGVLSHTDPAAGMRVLQEVMSTV